MPQPKPAAQADSTSQLAEGDPLAATEAANYERANADYRQPPAETPKEE